MLWASCFHLAGLLFQATEEHVVTCGRQMQLCCLRIFPAMQARACKHLNSTVLEDFSPKASNFRCCFFTLAVCWCLDQRMVLQNGAEVVRHCQCGCGSLEIKSAPAQSGWLWSLLSQWPWPICQLKSILYPAWQSWVYKGADVGSLSAFPWTRFLTTLCCSASVELMQLQLGTAGPVCLPGQCFCPSFATSECGWE